SNDDRDQSRLKLMCLTNELEPIDGRQLQITHQKIERPGSEQLNRAAWVGCDDRLATPREQNLGEVFCELSVVIHDQAAFHLSLISALIGPNFGAPYACALTVHHRICISRSVTEYRPGPST